MTRIQPSLVVAIGLALWIEGAATADEPEPEEPPVESVAGATSVAPDPGVTTVPAPPPAPLLAAPANGAPASGEDEDAETKILRADPRFGDPGQVALSGALSASIGHVGYDSSGSSGTSIGVAPAFDYFASRDFSQGASALFRYSEGTSGFGVKSNSTTLGAAGRVGRNFWLGGRFSFWPRLGFEVWRAWLHFEAPSAGFVASIGGTNFPLDASSDFTEQGLTVELEAPVLVHITRHFFVGFGPDVSLDVFHSVEGVSNRRRFLGASSLVGGWF